MSNIRAEFHSKSYSISKEDKNLLIDGESLIDCVYMQQTSTGNIWHVECTFTYYKDLWTDQHTTEAYMVNPHSIYILSRDLYKVKSQSDERSSVNA